jgi:hypothetical protein
MISNTIRRDQLPYVLLFFISTFAIYFLAKSHENINLSFIYQMPNQVVPNLKPKPMRLGLLLEVSNSSIHLLGKNVSGPSLVHNRTSLQPRENKKNWCKTVLNSLLDKPGITEVQQMRQAFKIRFNISDTTQPTFSRIASSLAYNVSVLVLRRLRGSIRSREQIFAAKLFS